MSGNDLKNLTKGFSFHLAMEEAHRCLLCHEPLCQTGCPASVKIREFIRKIRFHNFRGAARTLRRDNALAAVCGWVCPTEVQCRRECLLGKYGSAIDIAGLQRFIAHWELENPPEKELEPVPKTQKIAVIGAGPAGLSAAWELALTGFSVTLFDKEKSAGGLLFKGIPPSRLPRGIARQEVDLLLKKNVHFKGEAYITNLDQITDDYDAVIIGTGLGETKKLTIPGHDLSGIVQSSSFLREPEQYIEQYKPIRHAVVIGGGNSAMDAALTLQEQNVPEVFILYRRGFQEMPAWEREIISAQRKGIRIRPYAAPRRFSGSGRVESISCFITQPATDKTGADGRVQTNPLSEVEIEVPADFVILAIGEMPEKKVLQNWQLDLKPDGYIAVDEYYRTSSNKIYAAGDVIGAPFSVAKAVNDGKLAARAVISDFSASSSDAGHLQLMSPVSPQPVGDQINVKFLDFSLQNPFILAAGPSTDNMDMLFQGLERGWAGAVLKTTSVEGTAVDLKYPMISQTSFDTRRISGLGNIDLISCHHIDVIAERVSTLKKRFPSKFIVASIMGSQQEDWQYLARRLKDAGVDAIECSFSCPQGTLGSKPGFMLGQDPALVLTVTRWIVDAAAGVPVVIKITPQVTDIVEIAQAVKNGGARAICASNSIPSLMGVNIQTGKPLPSLQNYATYSGLTGPAIKPITLRTIAEIARHVELPITGTGGPLTWGDAVEYLRVGCSTIQFCTAVMHYGFEIIDDLVEGLADFLTEHHYDCVADIIGSSLPFLTTHDHLPSIEHVYSTIDSELCIHCGRCYIACQDGGHQAIKWQDNRVPEVINDRCPGCGLCIAVCPVPGCISQNFGNVTQTY
ncbi:NAD-dependent dihydropyrimidine dehydrogenase subunit PreA [candidate division CSSED10-310 bacterium]|uniref:dihydrouracil dehydrogenase (NAD(+)) n=1 Tax=candidate division CSSED10-310 bacterium TaxID=2855610 RepID=A0ABV6YU47_UNCC1